MSLFGVEGMETYGLRSKLKGECERVFNIDNSFMKLFSIKCLMLLLLKGGVLHQVN